MKLKSKVKDLNEVDEQYRALYTKVGDAFELTGIDGINELSAVSSLVNTASTQYEQLKAKFKDVDPTKYAELVASENEFKQLEARIEEAKSSLTKQLTDQFNTERTRFQTEQKELEDALHEALVVQAATAALSKVAPDNVALLLPHVTAQMKVVKGADGKRVAQILDDKQQPRVITTPEGVKPLPLWDESEKPGPSLLAEMRENKQFMGGFPAVNKGGGGADPNTGAAGGGGAVAGGGAGTVQIPRELAKTNYREYSRLSSEAKEAGKTIELTD
jgi:hypothetical protein